ncbi:MAG: hypothetical protein REI78_15900 [Pedobacter sp.]|nr:hypothetical protein [Pedobacter sp.]MDQ8054513.1 hypothetical protein [Pedobacter sp.]
MKSMIRSAILLGLVLIFAGTTQKALAQDEDVSLQSFYDELSPYGVWIQDPQYGYVWRPDVDQDEFRPYYTNGRWAMTEYGNTWVSNYDWGWAPFHYGRWIYNRYNQWVWLPDTTWGPAWVSWRSGGGYYGWAPMGPSVSVNINIGGGYRIPDMCWNFIPYSNIYYSNYPRYSYIRNRTYIQNTVIINNTYIRNNRTYYTGPRIDDIRRATNQRVNVYSVNRSHSPGVSRIENNRINIYQPQARPGRDNGSAAPRNAVRGNISREQVGRNVTANRGDARPDHNYQGNRGNDNRYQGNRQGSADRGNVDRGNTDRGNSPYSRPQRTENSTGRDNNDRNGNAPQQGTVNQRPSVFGRSRGDISDQQRAERNNQLQEQNAQRQRDMQQQQQVEHQRAERQQDAARDQAMQRQREAQQQQQQAERQQRMERPQPQQSAPRMERAERPQAQPQQRGSSGNENRGGGRPGGGRPGRG